MIDCTLGKVQVSWEPGDPLVWVLRDHDVYAVTACGKALAGTLRGLDDRRDFVGRGRLYPGDLIFHNDEACDTCVRARTGTAYRPSDAAAGTVTFWLARLHHRRLHGPNRPLTPFGIACPKCRLEYFSDCDPRPSHQAIMEAGVTLYQECPDHAGAISVPAGGRRPV